MALGDDLQRLFSWLQTPDLRYREFAGEREIPDRPATSDVERETVEGELAEPARTGLRQPDFAEPEPPAATAPPAEEAAVPPGEEAAVPPGGEAAEPPPARRSGLLGGAYRGDTPPASGAEPPAPPPEDRQQDAGQRTGRSLDSVFGRLSGTRDRLPDPRERPPQRPGTPGGDRSR